MVNAEVVMVSSRSVFLHEDGIYQRAMLLQILTVRRRALMLFVELWSKRVAVMPFVEHWSKRLTVS